DAPATAPWTDGVYLVGPGLGSGRYPGEASYSFDLAQRGSYEASLDVTIPSVGEEQYRIEVRADHRGQVYEGGRDHNNASDTGPLGMLHPNLTIASLTLDRATLTSGEDVHVTWEVHNAGA